VVRATVARPTRSGLQRTAAGRTFSRMDHPKTKISVTLAHDAVRAVDRATNERMT